MAPNRIRIVDYAEPAAACLAVAAIVTACHWRNWFNADGRVDWKKVVGDFVFVPTLMVIGCLVVGLNIDLIWTLIGIAAAAFVGSSFLMATIEKLRDGVLGVIVDGIRAKLSLLLGGAKK